jgi:ribosomal protein S18 acetylase RimI-like enzyme
LYDLYVRSFPENERRSHEGFVQLFEKQNSFYCTVLMHENRFVGFLTFWEFNHFVYIEHFAISPQQRGQSLGSSTLKQFMKSISKPIVLEVELPESDTAKRRIRFYECLGFCVCNHSYKQPPYDKNKENVPMLLMCSKKDFLEKNFEETRNTLYKYVYSQEV